MGPDKCGATLPSNEMRTYKVKNEKYTLVWILIIQISIKKMRQQPWIYLRNPKELLCLL